MKQHTKREFIIFGIILSLALFIWFLTLTEMPMKMPMPPPPVKEEPLPLVETPVEKRPIPKSLPKSAPPPSPFLLIDRILEKMELGNIAFNAPRSMNLKETALIQLVLSLAKPIEELKKMIKAEGEKEGATIRISNRMEARLSGPNFQITAITPEEQAITLSNVTEWKWEIKPMSSGLQRLHLTLTALFTIDGTSTSRAIRTFDKTIEVQVTWGQRAAMFFQQNWQWLWAAIIIPIVGWLWKRKRRKKDNKQGLK